MFVACTTTAMDGCRKKGLSSCWADGDGTHLPKVTTYNGRTYLQPQLNKVRRAARAVAVRAVAARVAQSALWHCCGV